MAPMTKIKWGMSFAATMLALVSGTILIVPHSKIMTREP